MLSQGDNAVVSRRESIKQSDSPSPFTVQPGPPWGTAQDSPTAQSLARGVYVRGTTLSSSRKDGGVEAFQVHPQCTQEYGKRQTFVSPGKWDMLEYMGSPEESGAPLGPTCK